MSDVVEYRRLVASIARKLSAEERQQIAFIRLDGEDTSKYSPQNKDATGIDLFAKLERLRVFSKKDIDGLMDVVAKDVNRNDLVDDIKVYRKNAKTSSKQTKKKQQKKTKEPSAERQELEGTFEMLVVKMSVLAQYLSMLQRTLDGEGNIQDEGAEIMRIISESVQGLASDLNTAHEKLARRPNGTLSTNSSASSLDSKRSSSSSIGSQTDPNSPTQSLGTLSHPNHGSQIEDAATSTPIQTPGIRANTTQQSMPSPHGPRTQETVAASTVNPTQSPRPKPKPRKNFNHLCPPTTPLHTPTERDEDRRKPPGKALHAIFLHFKCRSSASGKQTDRDFFIMSIISQ